MSSNQEREAFLKRLKPGFPSRSRSISTIRQEMESIPSFCKKSLDIHEVCEGGFRELTSYSKPLQRQSKWAPQLRFFILLSILPFSKHPRFCISPCVLRIKLNTQPAFVRAKQCVAMSDSDKDWHTTWLLTSGTLNWTIHEREIQLSCYNNQFSDHGKTKMTCSCDQSLCIIPYDAILGSNWWSVTYCLVF